MLREKDTKQKYHLSSSETEPTQETIERLRRQNELILTTLGEGVFELDLQGKFVSVNPAAENLVGYTATQLIGQSNHLIWHHTKPDGKPYSQDICPILKACRDGEVHRGDDIIFWRKDGACFPVEFVSAPIREGDKIIGTMVIFRDISHRKQTEEELQTTVQQLRIAYRQAIIYAQELTGEVAERRRVEEELRQYTGQLEVLETISAALRKARTSQQIGQTLLATTVRTFNAQGGTLFLLDGEKLTPVLSLNSNGENINQPSHSLDELIQRVVSTGYPFFVSDLSTENNDSYQTIAPAILMPLQTVEITVGVLHLVFQKHHTFSKKEYHLLTAISEIAGNALHRSIIMETLEQRVADRTHELAALYDVTVLASGTQELGNMLEQSLEKILEVGRCEAVCIHLADEYGDELHPAACKGIPPDQRLVTRPLPIRTPGRDWGVGRDNKPIIMPNLTTDTVPPEFRLTGFHSCLSAPMRVKGRVLGMLSLFWQSSRNLTLEEIVLLSTIADQMGVAAEISRLRQRVAVAAVIEERQRLARELHDSITQSLYGQTLLARTGRDALDDGDITKGRDTFANLGENALYALKEMRLLLYELRPAILEQEGLARALGIRLDTVERRVGIKVQFEVDEGINLPQHIEGELYRIAIEALNNALKHAEASLVNIRLASSDNQLKLTITDNGRGFNPDEVGEGCIGLKSMRERAYKLGGEVSITSAAGSGTEVVVSIKVMR